MTDTSRAPIATGATIASGATNAPGTPIAARAPIATGTPIANQPRRLVWSRQLTWLCLGGLVLLFTWLNATRPEGSSLRWLVQCTPLLILVPGLLRQSYRSYSWLCFVVLLYFIPATTQVVMLMGYRNAEQPIGYWSDGVFLLLVVVLFFSATLTSRWLQYWQLQTDMRNDNEPH